MSDGSRAADATADDHGSADPSLSPPPARELNEEDRKYLDASDFEILFESTACFGTCPVYALRLRSDGSIRFIGYQYVSKPGAYDTNVSAESVRELYDSIVRRGFLDFHSAYTFDQNCDDYWTDSPHSFYVLRADGAEKAVEFDRGCKDDNPALDALDAIQREILAVAQVQQFLETEPTSRSCSRPSRQSMLASSYVIRDPDGSARGMLHITPDRIDFREPWSVTTCEGQELSRGPMASEWGCGRVILPAGVNNGVFQRPLVERVHDDDLTLHWPGLYEPQSAIVLSAVDVMQDGYRQLDVRALTLRGETAQHAEAGDRCD
ncbi:MAG TPA: DUF6438 domain-containing protein [Polyangiales bacterium]|nr:DUF6438 domain-containing protein [Polyangiales bacterium]